MSRASIVVPTFKEADNLAELFQRIHAALPDCEIVVIDDASPDGTAAKARELGATVIERHDERGLSTAALRGIKEAKAEICVVMDADLSHPPEKIPDLVRAVEEGADMAIGSRYVKGGEIDDWPLTRRLTSGTGTLLARPLTPARDPLAGFFCLRKKLLDGIELKPKGFKILLEILARAKPAKIVEVPIRFQDREAGLSKFGPKQRREYLHQLGELYVDLNAWPLRLLKFLTTGGTGVAVNLAVLWLLVEKVHWAPKPHGAAGAWVLAMTWNYALNRFWTFRARRVPFLTSYVLFAVSMLGGLGVQIAVMYGLGAWHYLWGASIGILTGTVFNYLAAELVAFRRR